MLPALALGGALLAFVLPRLGRLRHLGELLALVAEASGLQRGLFLSEPRNAVGVAGACALGALLLVARRLPRRPAMAGVAVLAVVVAVVGFARQRDFYDARYHGADP